jgi:hypothetical protein
MGQHLLAWILFSLLIPFFLITQSYLFPKFIDRESGWKDISGIYPFIGSNDGILVTGLLTPCYFRYVGKFKFLLDQPYLVSVWATDSGIHFRRPKSFLLSKDILIPWEKFERGMVKKRFTEKITLSVAGWRRGHFEFSMSTYRKLIEVAGPTATNKNKSLAI